MKKFIIVLIMAWANSANAGSITSKIEKVGCHIDANMCFVYLKSTIDTSCSKNDRSLRWDGVSTPNSDKIYALLLAAQASDISVTFGGAGDSCFESFPTFRWAHNYK